jgi:glycosyltransferase involved in cell wall biosynthesis
MAFPSKLADCTAVGVPLVIYGPSYCSAVRWANENPGVAKVIEDPQGLGDAVHHLANDPALRQALGLRALEIGEKYFAYDAVREVFNRALISG